MASDHNNSSQEGYIPHYLQKEDPFASKLSREADIIAGFYLTIIGNDFIIGLCILAALQNEAETAVH